MPFPTRRGPASPQAQDNQAIHSAGPVRNVSRTSRGLTGVVAEMGRFESTLERDMMELVRFDRNVSQFVPQPLVIRYRRADDKVCTYTPDGLIHYRASSREPSVLYEVKFREDFRNAWREYLPKFRAAKAFCQERGWSFCVFTEKEIRTTYLSNVKFLWPYLGRKVDPAIRDHVLTVLWDLQGADPDFLLHALSSLPSGRGHLIPVLWHMVAVGDIGCDLDEKLTMATPIWPMREPTP